MPSCCCPSLPLFSPLFQCAQQQIYNYPHSRVLVDVKLRREELFSGPGLSTHPIRRLLHSCIYCVVVGTKCFGRSCWELPLKIYPAKTQNAPPQAHTNALHHCHQLTHAHCDILTDCLIANEAEGHDWCAAWLSCWVSIKQRWFANHVRFILLNSSLCLYEEISIIFPVIG